MIEVSEAAARVLAGVGRLPSETCKLEAAAGRILRQAVAADRDGPPFDRATLDGVCLRHADWEAGGREFTVAGLQAAGAEPVGAPPPGACLEIMTGAPVPDPCDCVLPVESFTRTGDTVRAAASAVLDPGSGVHRRGSDFRSGDVLLEGGRVLTGREIAVAASCGCAQLEVAVQPKIALLATGDELVDIEDVPRPHQIRRSNDLALRAALLAAGFSQIELNHLPDDQQAISWNLERLLQQADVILVTGGISRGRFDHVPGILGELGVKEVFRGVAQRPGKPMYFGAFERPGDFLHPEDTRVVAVFALPGNPVSCYTCLHRYVLPALRRMGGIEPLARRPTAALAHPFRPHPRLTLFLPVVLASGEDGRLLAEPRPCNTSGDFASVAATDGFLELPAGAGELRPGTVLPLIRWT